jgi:predicted RNase H-like HicB family nuclease
MMQEITEPEAIVWKEGGAWLGYLRRYPNYWTQGSDLDDLREHLCDLRAELTSGSIPAIESQEDA